ncbi:MAG: deoxyribonuclease IV [Proteobacteria bacterium]|nr:deoxyribonuclease IV [Desulfobulbaceae bacterium]MBU4151667.1 deoxyribonuclease IV [Pseudomonadota bacterium]MDP2105015.1 deoxyribonuclease IV [Desulfobulbaceae bacterium]
MKYVGAHVSIAGGVENAPLHAELIGAKAFAMFTKNQRQWQAKPLEDKNIRAFRENLERIGIQRHHVLPHDGYLINLGNSDPDKRQRSVNAFIDEAQRVEQLGLKLLNFHPGSHLNEISEEQCMDLIAEGIQQAIAQTQEVVFVLESTAGQGSNIGYTFEQLAMIIERVGLRERMGVCLDTCHLYAAGYDIKEKYHAVVTNFDQALGFDLLKGVHLNDSKSALGQKLDRHHSLGDGQLGWEVFARIMQDLRFDHIPLILETIDSDRWPEEISRLYGFSNEARVAL